MSEPTYRIRIERDEAYDEHEDGAWDAIIFRVSSGEKTNTVWGRTPEIAQVRAFDWITRQVNVPRFITLYATEDGELCDPPAPVEPKSLRA